MRARRDAWRRYPPFLSFRPADGGSTDAFATDLRCLAVAGTDGCGFEQPLEAILKALTPLNATTWTAPGFAPVDPPFYRRTAGHGDGENAGFSREGSVLAIIALTDEDDCSAVDPELFNPATTIYPTSTNLRCFTHPTALHPIERYVDGILQLRARPGLLVFAPIVGIPVDLQPGEDNYSALIGDESVRDPRMIERIDPTTGDRLVPSCDDVGTGGGAFPPLRIVEVARGLDAQAAAVTVNSICDSTLRDAMTNVINAIFGRLPRLGRWCLARPLSLGADGSVPCDVVARMPMGVGCDALPGSVEREPSDDGRSNCAMAQLISADRSDGAALPEGDGWAYDTFSTEGRDECANRPTEPFQRLLFRTLPPFGARLSLECFLPVDGTDPTMVSIGTFCDPTSDTLCPGGAAPGDPAVPLSCDIVTRACGVGCSTSADCRSSGLVGFVCDTRNLEDVDEEFAGNTTPYNFCVNPTCG